MHFTQKEEIHLVNIILRDFVKNKEQMTKFLWILYGVRR